MPMMDDYQVMRIRFSIPGTVDNGGYVLFSHPVIMSHTSIHEQDRDHRKASSTSSLMGIDAATSIDERVALLDVEREPESAQYGTTTQLTNGGANSILQLLPFNVFCLGRKHTLSQSTVAKRVKYYIPSLAWIPNYSLSLYVPVIPNAVVQISSLSIVLEATLWPE